MKKEERYQFRQDLLTVHESNIRDFNRVALVDELEIKDGFIVEIADTTNIVIINVAHDFVDFLKTSMGVNASVSTANKPSGKGVIRLALAKDEKVDLGIANGYKGFFAIISDGIDVFGHDDRGIATGLHYLEDLMTFEKAPILKRGNICKRPAMTPLMVHSGYGAEEWPDEYLNKIAHQGRDAILVFTKGPNQTRIGYLDFNDLIERASKYGIDVYAYSFIFANKHPDEDDAEQFYDSLYGELFRAHPGLKGVTLVGEVVEFRSKDPHVSKFLSSDTIKGGIPDTGCWPGWWPCEDLPKWIDKVKKVIRKVKPDADIVLWSYNWGCQPEEDRVKLIENLPTDITLQATFEMFDYKEFEGAKYECSDYSLAFPGPSKYFTSEAIAAKKRGLKLYSMTQTNGTTWDFGCASYEPMPYQWMKRLEGIRNAITDWDLKGGMECHHHGFYPNFISKFAYHAYLLPFEPLDVILDRILASEFGKDNLDKLHKGFELWSDAIEHYTPTTQDFCGASRVGPAYPFNLFYPCKIDYDPEAMFGSRVISPRMSFGMDYPSGLNFPDSCNFLNLRIFQERKLLVKCRELMLEGVAVLESIENKNEKLLKVINLGKYLANCVLTNIHAKDWHVLTCKLKACYEKQGLLDIVKQMKVLLYKEIENAKNTIPIVEVDSRLGWEPSMLYLGDKQAIEWKIRQVNYVLTEEIVALERKINF